MPLNSADGRGFPSGRKSSSKHSQGSPEAGLLPEDGGIRKPRLQAGEHVTSCSAISTNGLCSQPAVIR
jgi:hypothetical protein